MPQRTLEEVATTDAPQQVSPAEAIKRQLKKYEPIVERALPTHVNLDQFMSTILTCVRSDPNLLRVDPASLAAAAVKAAQLGLEPNDGRGLCAIIPYGREAQFQVMYKGAVELARRSGLVERVVARTVYENDEFDYEYGTGDEHLTHRPVRTDRGPSVLWYAIAWSPEGRVMDFVVLTRDDVEYHRSFSKQRNGNMWSNSYDAAARKTAVWELMKLLPQSTQLAQAMAADEKTVHLDDEGLVVIDDDDRPEQIGEVYRDHPAALEAPAEDVTS